MTSTGRPLRESHRRKKIPLVLSYEGKEDSRALLARPYREFERIVSINGGGENRFYFGDNDEALLALAHSSIAGRVSLIYIDPPFATSSEFVDRSGALAYTDALVGGEFVEFLRKRLITMRELLSDSGSIYVQLDGNMAFAMKIAMDEIFGEENHRAFITRKKCSVKNFTKRTYGNVSDYLLFYSKTSSFIWNRPYDPWKMDQMLELYPYVDDKGRRYKKVPIHAPGVRNGETGKEWRGKAPPKGKHWQYAPEKLDELDAMGEIAWSATGNPRRKVFCDPNKGAPVQDIWLNFRDSVNQSQKTTGYPTEKNYDMLKMIVEASSRPGDLVMDCFAGGGTFLGAADEAGRRWIGMDSSVASVEATVRRFTLGTERYGDYVRAREIRPLLFEENVPFDIYSTPENGNIIRSLDCASTKQCEFVGRRA